MYFVWWSNIVAVQPEQKYFTFDYRRWGRHQPPRACGGRWTTCRRVQVIELRSSCQAISRANTWKLDLGGVK